MYDLTIAEAREEKIKYINVYFLLCVNLTILL